jgi:hypothetical protein
MNHFFGYYAIQPWNADGTYLLCLEVPFQDHMPSPEDKATVGVVECSSGRFIPLADTRAWNFQQASMMHWLPTAPKSEIIFNDRQANCFMSVILNVHTREHRTLTRPIAAISKSGKRALSLNFSRLQWGVRRDYGYAGVDDVYAGKLHPLEESIYSIDLESDEQWPVVSLADVFATLGGRIEEMKKYPVCFNHVAYNTDDSRFAFLIQWSGPLFPKWMRIWKLKKLERGGAIMFTAKTDGSDLQCLTGFGNVSHYDWRSPSEILMWAKRGDHSNFYLVAKDQWRSIADGVLTEDGHCSFSPDREWIVTDTYPDRTNHRTLKLFRWENGPQIILGRFYSSPTFTKEIRCDLHPRWDRPGTQICFDSIHEGTRQLYVIDVSNYVHKVHT